MDRRLPEDDAVAAEAGHQVLRDRAHAHVRLGAEVREDVLGNTESFCDQDG